MFILLLIINYLKYSVLFFSEKIIVFRIFVFQDEFSQFEANDPFIQNFIVQIDSLFVPFKVNLYRFIDRKIE